MLTLVLTQLGLPLEVVGFVTGVDPILDRLRTMSTVTGDLAVNYRGRQLERRGRLHDRGVGRSDPRVGNRRGLNR